ncbi:MAG: NAD(P)/FAD-dependent oxidoreductase [Ferruginibacter sp.]
MKQTTTIIIGASISGLACAACLAKQNIEYIIIEMQNSIAFPWRNHYHRLHLHTNKKLSNLPYRQFKKSIPNYASRLQVIDYLEDYQKEFNINPVFNTKAISVKKVEDYWIIETTNGSFKSKYLIMATGAYGKPKPVSFKGMETFTGKIMHSCDYKTAKDFEKQKVLVVGFGNSACEIAIDLCEQKSLPSMAVRSPVNVIPRDIFGISVLRLSLLLSFLPPSIADKLSYPLIRLLIGDITKLGLKKLPYGPLVEINKEGKVPLLDIGTIKHIKNGDIKIYADIDYIKDDTVHFKDGKKEIFDAIIAAIGYYRDYDEILGIDKNRFLDLQVSVDKQKYFGSEGLYFCGYWISPTGQIREIGLDAKKIATDIQKKKLLENKFKKQQDSKKAKAQ